MDPLEKESVGRQSKSTEKLDPVDFSSNPEQDPETQKIRDKIHGLLDVFEAKGLATKKTIEAYRKGAENDSNPENLKKYCEWIEESLGMAKGALGEVEGRLENGVRNRILSSADHNRLLEGLLAEGDFVGKMREGKIMQQVEEALGQFQRDRETYDRIQTDPRFYNGGIQQRGRAPLLVPDLKAFLEMSLKARRAFLDKVRKILDRPVVGRKKSSPEEIQVKERYQDKLAAARKEGVIGASVVQKFMGYFTALDSETKKVAFQNLDQILEPYAKLWAEIRNTFTGPLLKRLEGLRDSMDHQQLRAQFETTVSSEGLRIEGEYAQKLEKARTQKILPLHIGQEWKKSMKEAKLDGKRKQLESLDGELLAYEKLRQKIDATKDRKLREKMEIVFEDPSKRLEEIQDAFGRMDKDKEGGDKGTKGREAIQVKILSEVKNARVRNALEKTQKESTHEEKRTMLGRLRYYLSGRRAEDFKTFQQNVSQARVGQGAVSAEKGVSSDHLSAEKVAREEVKSNDGHGKAQAKISAKGTFVETEIDPGAGKGKKIRVVNMVLSDKSGRKGFNELQKINSETDKISLSTGKNKEDRDLNWREMKVLEKSLAADIEKTE
jgi:hypothetical protein